MKIPVSKTKEATPDKAIILTAFVIEQKKRAIRSEWLFAYQQPPAAPFFFLVFLRGFKISNLLLRKLLCEQVL